MVGFMVMITMVESVKNRLKQIQRIRITLKTFACKSRLRKASWNTCHADFYWQKICYIFFMWRISQHHCWQLESRNTCQRGWYKGCQKKLLGWPGSTVRGKCWIEHIHHQRVFQKRFRSLENNYNHNLLYKSSLDFETSLCFPRFHLLRIHPSNFSNWFPKKHLPHLRALVFYQKSAQWNISSYLWVRIYSQQTLLKTH